MARRREAARLPLPDDVDPYELDTEVRRALRGLAKETADRVAGHLVVTGRLVDDDPEQAYQHAVAARALGGRVGVVREAVGIAAYRAGHWAEALSELRAARRMTGSEEHLPLMADCERALGRPERALDIARSPEASALPPELAVELLIVASGARRDLGQADAAVVTLQGRWLDDTTVHPWTPRLWYAYADALLDAGRTEEAVRWFTSVTTVDVDELTDAEERLAELLGEDEDGPGEDDAGGGLDIVLGDDATVLDGDVLGVEGDVADGEALDGEALDGEALDGEALDGEVLDGEALDGDGDGLDADETLRAEDHGAEADSQPFPPDGDTPGADGHTARG